MSAIELGEAWSEDEWGKVFQATQDGEGRLARVVEGAVENTPLGAQLPGVATLRAVLEPSEKPTLVYSLPAGAPLSRLALPKGEAAWSDAAAIGLALLRALEVAAAAGHGPHLALHPARIWIDGPRGARAVTLVDYGLASLVAKVRATRAPTLDEARYTSPELIDQAPADARADVYGVGLICFEICTGAPAVSATSLRAALEAQCTQPLPWPAEMRRHVPRGFVLALDRLTAKSPADRATLREAIELLEGFAPEVPATERLPGAPEPPDAAGEEQTLVSPVTVKIVPEPVALTTLRLATTEPTVQRPPPRLGAPPGGVPFGVASLAVIAAALVSFVLAYSVRHDRVVKEGAPEPRPLPAMMR